MFLAQFVPPDRVVNKNVYSPWTGSDLHRQLGGAGMDTVIITGGKTDVCVLATMLGAPDWDFRVILVTDALCSSANETHEAMINVYMNRFGEQIVFRAAPRGSRRVALAKAEGQA